MSCGGARSRCSSAGRRARSRRLGADGLHVTELLAGELRLAVPDVPWHAERDRIAEIGAVVGIGAGAMAKIATDLALLSQTEVGEASAGATTPDGRRRCRTSATP